MSKPSNQPLDLIGKLAKGIAIVLTALLVLVLIALRAFNNVNAGQYAGLSRYREADAKLASVTDTRRVVFMGDSITESWDLEHWFANRSCVNRGIGGQTTSQMVLRFHQDVVDLKPASVVILAGVNDIGAGSPLGLIESNYAAMAEMARENHIAVYFGSVLPVAESRRDFPLPKITALNRWLRDYCKSGHAVCVDYWTPMSDKNGFLQPKFSHDGIHPNIDVYKIMQSVLDAVIPPPHSSVAENSAASK